MYKYFTQQQASSEPELTKAWKDLQKKYHPDLHQGETGIDYTKITAEINNEYKLHLQNLKFDLNFDIFNASYDEIKRIDPEIETKTRDFVTKIFIDLINNSKIVPEKHKNNINIFIKKEFSGIDFGKKTVNLFRNLYKMSKK